MKTSIVVALGPNLAPRLSYARPKNTLPLQFLMLIFAEWAIRSQQDVIEYIEDEKRVLRDQLGGKRLLFTNSQRRRLVAKAKAIGRKGLFDIRTVVTPDTLLRWYRTLIAKKYDGNMARNAGHPKTAAEIEQHSITWAAGLAATRSSEFYSTTISTPTLSGTRECRGSLF